MIVQNLGTPCRNFSFMSAEYIPTDPKDGKEKYVMGTQSAHTLNAHIILIAPDTLEVEDIETPGDINIWAMMYLPEYKRLVIGTSGYYGYVHCLDMQTRTWMRSLRLDGQTYIWNFALGGDGKIYGSNYPGCIVYCYDPAEHTLISVGRASNNPDNLYSRIVHAMPNGNIMVSVSGSVPETYIFDINTRQFKQIFCPHEYAEMVTDEIVVTSGIDGRLNFYDVDTLELLEGSLDSNALEDSTNPAVIRYLEKSSNPYERMLPYKQDCHMKTLKDGRVVGIFKQQIFIIKDNDIAFYNVNATPMPMMIHALSIDENGLLWFASADGQAMGYYDPKTGKTWNSNAITNSPGQIYGIVSYGGKLYFTTYVGGDHVVYDPKQPWNQYENINPKTLRSVTSQGMGRPIAGSILGPDGNIWTGWCGVYNIYGGGVSRIDTKTHDVDAWFGLVPEQSIRYLAAGKEHVYATSHWMNSGLPYRLNEEFQLLRLNMDCDIVWSEKFHTGQHPECLAVQGDRLYMSMRDQLAGTSKLYVYDEQTMKLITVKEMGPLGKLGISYMEENSIRAMLPYGADQLMISVGDTALLIDAKTLETLKTAQLPGIPEIYTIDKDKNIYFSLDCTLYCLRF